jgi:putative ABC transport system permease protein
MLTDLRFALRTWRQNPIPALAAVLTLALGAGANTAIFSVIHAVMLKPLPYPQPDRLVQIWSVDLISGCR